MEKIEFLSIFKKQAIHTEAKSNFLSKLVILANFSTFQTRIQNLKKNPSNGSVFPHGYLTIFFLVFFLGFEQKLEFCYSVRKLGSRRIFKKVLLAS